MESFMYRKRMIYEEKRHRYPEVNLNIVSRNNIWEVRCAIDHGSSLLKRDSSPRKEVEELARFITLIHGGWDIVYYKSIVAFKNPCERITWIYPKVYFNARMHDSYQHLDVIKVNQGIVRGVLNRERDFKTGLPAY